MKVRKSEPAADYGANLQEINRQQYNTFFKECQENQKTAKKIKSPENLQKFKTLERCYRLMQSFGVPFAVANRMFPKLCDIIAEYQAFLVKQEKKDEN